MPLPDWARSRTEQLFFSTIRITVPGEGESGSSIGTGFLIGAPVPGSDDLTDVAFLLVSNRHVLQSATTFGLVMYQADQDRNVVEGRPLQIELTLDRGAISHPDP